jgi:hypothetical protein
MAEAASSPATTSNGGMELCCLVFFFFFLTHELSMGNRFGRLDSGHSAAGPASRGNGGPGRPRQWQLAG